MFSNNASNQIPSTFQHCLQVVQFCYEKALYIQDSYCDVAQCQRVNYDDIWIVVRLIFEQLRTIY